MPNSRNKRNKKYKNYIVTILLFCVFALSSAAMSFETQPRVLVSSGLITYPSGGTLHVTDSTPEGPVPYKIDGQSGYDTGSNSIYNISAGAHTIEMPSPYTVQGTTYYFVTWNDGVTNNPREFSVGPGETLELHGIYSLSPPTNGIPSEPPTGNWLGYATFEQLSLGRSLTDSNLFDYIESPLWTEYSIHDNAGYVEVSSTFTDSFGTTTSGGKCLHLVKTVDGDGGPCIFMRIRDLQVDSKYYLGTYESKWLYFPSDAMRSIDTWWLGGGIGGVTEAWTRDIGTDEVYADEYVCDTYDWIYKRYGYGFSDPNADVRWRISGGRVTRGSFEAMWWNYEIHKDWVQARTIHDPDFRDIGVDGVNTVDYPNAIVEYTPHEVPVDRWFRLERWLKRRTDGSGEMMIWITDPKYSMTPILLFSVRNIRTAWDLTGPQIWYCWLEARGEVGHFYMDDFYFANYNAHGV